MWNMTISENKALLNKFSKQKVKKKEKKNHDKKGLKFRDWTLQAIDKKLIAVVAALTLS